MAPAADDKFDRLKDGAQQEADTPLVEVKPAAVMPWTRHLPFGEEVECTAFGEEVECTAAAVLGDEVPCTAATWRHMRRTELELRAPQGAGRCGVVHGGWAERGASGAARG